MEGSLSNDSVLEQHIPWESYKMNGQISDRDFTLIKKYDKSPESVKASELDEVCVATVQTAYFADCCIPARWKRFSCLQKMSHAEQLGNFRGVLLSFAQRLARSYRAIHAGPA